MDFREIYYSIMKTRVKAKSLLTRQEELRRSRRRGRENEEKNLVDRDGNPLGRCDKSTAGTSIDESNENGNDSIPLEHLQKMTDLLLVELELLKVKQEQIKCDWYEIEIQTELQNARRLQRRLSAQLVEEMNSALTML